MHYLTDPEALELYEAWLPRVAETVRRAHAQTNGRRETDTADLAALRRDLASVNLHTLPREESDAAPGTALAAAQRARSFLSFAENDHHLGEHLAAILWLQQAYLTAHRALALDNAAATRTGATDTTGCATENEAAEGAEPDPAQPPADLRPESPGYARWFHGIPNQRGHRKPKQ